MAMVGKTAGIIAGLGVGLASGVFLAAVNPVLPRTDTTQIGTTQVGTGPSVADANEETAPQLGIVPSATEEQGDDTTTAPLQVVTPQPDPTEETLVTAQTETSAPLAVNVQGMESAPVDVGETKLALALPDTAPADPLQTLEIPTDQSAPEGQPNIASTPANPVVLKKPDLDTQSPSRAEPAKESAPVIVETGTQEQPITSDSPAMLATTEDAGALPPTIQGPADKIITPPVPGPDTESATADAQPEAEPEVATAETTAETTQEVAIEAVVEVEEEADKPNTSGTFKTVGSRIKTSGESTEDRLASLGNSSASRIRTIGESVTDVSAQGTAAAAEISALKRNANAFEPTSQPMVSIVVLDDGTASAQLDALRETGLPLAVALPVDGKDITTRANAYRKAGFEVLALAPRDVKLSLSGGQSDEQVAALLDKFFQMTPEAIGLIDTPSANLQKDQRLSRSVIKHFAKTGHGLITYDGGLNTVSRLAVREAVPAGTIFRKLDSDQERAGAFASVLNRTAREARSKGQVLVMLTPTPETVAALVEWSQSRNAKAVDFAPVSAALLNSIN